MYLIYFKRFIDIIISVIVLVLALPILILSICILFLLNDFKPFFYQQRPGKNGKLFFIIKLKTMNDRRDAHGFLLPDAMRISKFGRFVRALSIDELPQLINVLKGDMSLVGPRPLLVEYLPLYNNQQSRRHEVKPGITGWAQVNGRNAISWEQKFELDIWYVDNISFKLDLIIIYKTVIKVFQRKGISSSTSVTMEKFKGSK
ncbi:sugar transferase [Flavihumibacter sp. UBA7668]|uniref:sugar transferase n=1 Tax=Flavihumibacter sp. UBA7668 TaxID=1946542 RepID=UPI0025C17B84|nr:sugar transferase [Flavihumibacter sp. UBA7668]